MSQQAFPFTVMLFALVITGLRHNLFVCLSAGVCVFAHVCLKE